MSHKKVKILLLEKGLTISGMAQTLIDENLVDSSNTDSVRTMLTGILYGHAWYPTLAATLSRKFGINLQRPEHLQPIREAIKRVA